MTLSIPNDIFSDFEPAPEQRRAVELAAAEKLLVITGGPGVGKTFSINAILNVFEDNGLVTECACPTGKAAIRMTEQTGRPAGTIHRLLQWRPGGFHLDGSSEDGARKYIEADAVIIDEASMVDVELFAALTRALRSGTRLVIVGDVDQLPSIGAGRVLYDLLQTPQIPSVRLTKIFRQAEDSRIPYVAREINTGVCPELETLTGTNGDVLFADVRDPDRAVEIIVNTIKTHLPNKGIKADDVQILSPQRNGAVGVRNLNMVLQRELNPRATGKGVMIGDNGVLYEGDKVIQTKNWYETEVFNGEIGKVVKANHQGLHSLGGDDVIEAFKRDAKQYVCVIDYGDRKIAYTKKEASNLQLANAITVHKSQGSQFKVTIIPVFEIHSFMLTRPLLYTAATRAAEMLILIGQPSAIEKAVTNLRGSFRRTTLTDRLQTAYSGATNG